MIDVEIFLRDLPQDNDECILEILKRYLKYNENSLPHSSRSNDNIEIFRAALTELDAFRQIQDLEASLNGKHDAAIAENIRAIIRRLETAHAESRRHAAVIQAKENVREKIRLHKNTFFGFARLSSAERAEIHNHLQKIRDVIESSNIDHRKKNALLDRLNALSHEVDKAGTKMDGFVAVWVDLWFAFGAGAAAAKPAFDELKDVLKILYQSRAKEEQTSLPTPQDQLQLPAPGADQD
jgi:hypothetical protein